MDIPDRLSLLMSKIEAGQTVTQSDLRRVAALQTLDLAKAGRDFVREIEQREQQQIDFLRQQVAT